MNKGKIEFYLEVLYVDRSDEWEAQVEWVQLPFGCEKRVWRHPSLRVVVSLATSFIIARADDVDHKLPPHAQELTTLPFAQLSFL
jgi:hypothetical protein